MSSLPSILDKLFQTLPPRPISSETLDGLVSNAIAESQEVSTSSDNRKSLWEHLLRCRVYDLAEREDSALADDVKLPQYYEDLRDVLDVILSFTEHGACDGAVPFNIVQDLLETQTIMSCSHIFAWIEQRLDRLTVDMVPQKGKALVLLRTLNDLLRRLSKTGNNTKFCGRILTFLSAVFPLGERSGVNLRGEYGAQWEPVTYSRAVKEDKMDVDIDATKSGPQLEEGNVAKMERGHQEGGKPSTSKPTQEKSEEVKEEFYNTFWWLQLPFSRPTQFVQPGTLETFKNAVNTVMPVIKEATIKERAMMGSKAVVGSLKRKRESTPASSDDANRNYLFARFLTSPELLDLEIADTHFRRQFLFQLLILLSHLSQFTQTEKAKWTTLRNRSLQMDFTLEPDDAKWAQDTMEKAYEELRQTAPNGRAFADTVQTIIERENNWIKWKNDLCSPFDKEPLQVSLEESTATVRKRKDRASEYQHKLGSRSLSEIWALGYTDLRDLQMPFRPGEVRSFVREIERENARINMRKVQLERQMQARAKTAAAANGSGIPIPVSQNRPASVTQTTSDSSTHIAAPAPQQPQPTSNPVPTPAPASSPPLHPSLPAKPSSAKPSQRPVTPAPAPSPAPLSSSVETKLPVSTQPVKPTSPPIELSDPQIMKSEENKLRTSWLALRTARENHLHLFGKIGTGDILLLAAEIAKEAKEREEAKEKEAKEKEAKEVSGGTGSLAETHDAPAADTTISPAGNSADDGVAEPQDQLGTANEDVAMADSDKPAA